MTDTAHPLAPLRPGVHLFPADDGRTWFLAEPDERFTRLVGPVEALAALQSELHGGPPVEAVPADLRAALSSALAERGVLAEPDPRPAPAAAPRIRVTGSGPVAELVRRLLTSWAEVTPDPVGGGAAAEGSGPSRPGTGGRPADAPRSDHDVLVTCAGWLPDSSFTALDEHSRRTGTPWHRCHVDGTSVCVGPIQLPGGPGYRDWRGRRLAASPTPVELAAYWAHLDDPAAHHPAATHPDPAVAAVAAGVLVDDLQRWWRTREVPRTGWEHVVDRDDQGSLRLRHHPVLGLPLR